MSALKRSLQDVLRYPSALAGFVIILLLTITSIVVVIAIPYRQAVLLWRGGEQVWYQNPKYAAPKWFNWFRREKLFETIVLNSAEGAAVKSVEAKGETTEIHLVYQFDVEADVPPQELVLYFSATFDQKQPFVSLSWRTPDGREIQIGDFSVSASQVYRLSQDNKLQRRLDGVPPQQGLFAAPDSQPLRLLKGTYELHVTALTFEPDSDLDAELVIHGEVAGWAGTDHLRRDLAVGLLWGTPVAMAFGLLAALGTTVTTMIIAATGVWFGGWVDEVIQRITEVNLVLPFLPILIMVGTFYSRSIWVILGVTILLSIFGGAIKTYRAVFLQVKESPYIEAARAYGASGWRIIMRYMVPRIVPLLIPQIVILIPSYVFLEASLALLGLGDPILPTWGKIINEGVTNGALYHGWYYWVLQPSTLLMITGLAFAVVGFALDRVFNPRLREL